MLDGPRVRSHILLSGAAFPNKTALGTQPPHANHRVLFSRVHNTSLAHEGLLTSAVLVWRGGISTTRNRVASSCATLLSISSRVAILKETGHIYLTVTSAGFFQVRIPVKAVFGLSVFCIIYCLMRYFCFTLVHFYLIDFLFLWLPPSALLSSRCLCVCVCV